MIQAMRWEGDVLQLLDQTQLPGKTVYTPIRSITDAFTAIKELQVRGAPAIGITAAYGLYLGMRDEPETASGDFFRSLQEKISYLGEARPTAVNLMWALQSLKRRLQQMPGADVPALKGQLLEEALALHEDDRERCAAMGAYGQTLIHEGARILTHCNTGALATGGIGTALGVIYSAYQHGKKIHVYANETRPVLQGARLTAWELHQAGIPGQLICDSMGAFLMQQKKVDLVILGADRIAADGSVANKIGTYSLAVLAGYHQIPFYVAAPLSTVDMESRSGTDIPIEERPADEIRRVLNKCPITVPDMDCWNPAFDVTPPEMITAIITEKGIVRPPYKDTLRQLMKS